MKKSKTRTDIDARYQKLFADKVLTFGDLEQIKLLRDWYYDLERFDELEEARNPNAPLLKWLVRFSWREEDEEVVEARTAEEAEAIVYDDYEYVRDDLEIYSVEPT